MRNTFLLVAVAAAGAVASCARPYHGPESAEFDTHHGRVLVGNTGGGIVARAADGSVTPFTTEPVKPYGIELLSNVLYVADSGFVKGYDADDAHEVLRFAVPGADFLNGIAADGLHTLYVSDFGGRTIRIIDVADRAAPVQLRSVPTGESTPNGVVHDAAGNRLLIATWGANAKILALDLASADATPQTLIQTTLGNLDGIALDCNGAILVTAWNDCGGKGGCLRRFDPPFRVNSPAHAIADGLSKPADIDYDPASGLVAVPESGANGVTLVPSGCKAAASGGDKHL